MTTTKPVAKASGRARRKLRDWGIGVGVEGLTVIIKKSQQGVKKAFLLLGRLCLVMAPLPLVLGGAEVVTRLWRHPTQELQAELAVTYHRGSAPHTVADPVLGFRSKANADAEATASRGGEVLHSVHYRTDNWGRRLVPRSDSPRPEFAAFFGCSYTFGSGVEDDQTLPSRVQILQSNYQTYNYGFGGWGPQQAVAWWDFLAVERQITQSTGVVIYTFIDDHLRRSRFAWRDWLENSAAGLEMPYYQTSANQGLQWLGLPSHGRWYYRALAALYPHSQFLQKAAQWLPSVAGDRELFLQLMERMRQRVAEKKKGSRFVVLVHPGSREGSAIAAELKHRGVTVLDYSQLWTEYALGRWTFDHHPTPEAYQQLALQLVKDLPRLSAPVDTKPRLPFGRRIAMVRKFARIK